MTKNYGSDISMNDEKCSNNNNTVINNINNNKNIKVTYLEAYGHWYRLPWPSR